MNLPPLTAGMAALLAACTIASAQTSQLSISEIVSVAREAAAAEPVEEKVVPILSLSPDMPGTYWGLQRDLPPLPFLPFPELETIEIAPGIYLFDDRAVDYDAVYRYRRLALSLQTLEGEYGLDSTAMTVSSIPFPGDGEGDTNEWYPEISYSAPVYGSNDLWLSIENAHGGVGVVDATLHGVQATNVYMLAGCTDLHSAVWVPQKVLHPAADSNEVATTFSILDHPQTVFFRAQTWNDTTPLGVPWWWIFQHFGLYTNLPSGFTEEDLLAAYQNGGNPNSVSFYLTTTNEYSASTVVPVMIETKSGYPTAVAVLVDETNLEQASWNSFSSTVLADLGPIEGWHTIYIGVRGSSDYPPTWEQVRVKFDTTPPQIVITSPSNSVSQPMIQVNGFSPESLSSLSCDLTNAAGVSSNELISVLRQVYDPDLKELTTNIFQAL